ncbi:MAG: hypothetical protein HQ503_17490 [Rhodospirillales bacterium]|nr:hypothetical protein [Rhodospirillales bacterium]
MSKIFRLLTPLLLSVLLTGCITYSLAYSYVTDVNSFLPYSVKDGRLAVVILGDPIEGARRKIEKMVIDALDFHQAKLHTRFIATPAADKPRHMFVFSLRSGAVSGYTENLPGSSVGSNAPRRG